MVAIDMTQTEKFKSNYCFIKLVVFLWVKLYQLMKKYAIKILEKNSKIQKMLIFTIFPILRACFFS